MFGNGRVHKAQPGSQIFRVLRFGDHLVHHPQLSKVPCGDLHDLAGLRHPPRVFPQDGGKALRGEDGVHRVLQHQHLIAHGQGEGTAAAALAADDGYHGYCQAAHEGEAPGDGVGLPPLLGLQTRIGAGGVHEGDNGAAELLRLGHDALGLPVALGLRHAKVGAEVLLQVLTLPGADDSDGSAMVAGDAAEDGGIIPLEPVAPLFKKLSEKALQVIRGARPLRRAGQGQPLLGRKMLRHCRHLFLP